MDSGSSAKTSVVRCSGMENTHPSPVVGRVPEKHNSATKARPRGDESKLKIGKAAGFGYSLGK
jgi:hypothetical protein